MNAFVRRGYAHFILAALQACVAVVMLDWALPLFFEPPILGNGLAGMAGDVEDVVKKSDKAEQLAGAGSLLRWLFARTGTACSWCSRRLLHCC